MSINCALKMERSAEPEGTAAVTYFICCGFHLYFCSMFNNKITSLQKKMNAGY